MQIHYPENAEYHQFSPMKSDSPVDSAEEADRYSVVH